MPPPWLMPPFSHGPGRLGGKRRGQRCYMPTRPARPCRNRACSSLTLDPSGYCSTHKKQQQRQIDANRGTSTERGYNTRWTHARKMYLAAHPLCVICLVQGKVVAAQVVDHIIPHRGDYALMWSESNWQSLCAFHHGQKTAIQDGAFGNAVKQA